MVFADKRKHHQVKTVHCAQDDHHQADLRREKFNRLVQVARPGSVIECQGHVAEVDQIETDNQQIVDGVGDAFVAMKAGD